MVSGQLTLRPQTVTVLPWEEQGMGRFPVTLLKNTEEMAAGRIDGAPEVEGNHSLDSLLKAS